jgi:hypothetical protein
MQINFPKNLSWAEATFQRRLMVKNMLNFFKKNTISGMLLILEEEIEGLEAELEFNETFNETNDIKRNKKRMKELKVLKTLIKKNWKT